MQTEELDIIETLDQKEAARYIGRPLQRLKDQKRYGGCAGTPCPLPIPGSRPVQYRIKDLKAWLEWNEHAADDAEAKYERDPSRKAKSFPSKSFSELLVDLETWLATHRPDFLKTLNGPVAHGRLDQFEQSTGLMLPEDYKLLLTWRNGQLSHWESSLDPFTGETLMSLEHAEKDREILNSILASKGSEDFHWEAKGLPFMADIFGNNTCLDLSPTCHGIVFYYDHEGVRPEYRFKDLRTWLAQLLGKLEHLDVPLWEREQAAWE